MSKVEIKEIQLVGLSLKTKTVNTNGQSGIDCGNLWQEFEKGKYSEVIPNKLGEEIFGVYHQYEGDSSQPFSYFIGCKVNIDTEVPQDMNSLFIPEDNYSKVIARGIMPDCITNSWRDIWASKINRAYNYDFEIYDEGSKDWSNAEVEIFISSCN